MSNVPKMRDIKRWKVKGFEKRKGEKSFLREGTGVDRKELRVKIKAILIPIP